MSINWLEGEALPPVRERHCARCGRVLLLEGPFDHGYAPGGARIVGWELRCPLQTRRGLVALLFFERRLHDHFRVIRWDGHPGGVEAVPFGRIEWR